MSEEMRKHSINYQYLTPILHVFLITLVVFLFAGCNVVMDYHLDECDLSTDQTIKDYSDTDNDATAKHGTGNTDSKFARTCEDPGAIICGNLEFKGEGYSLSQAPWYRSAQYYIEAPDNNKISPLNSKKEMTISGWFKTANDGSIISKLNEYRVFIEGGTLKVTIWNRYGSQKTTDIKTSVADGTWNFYAVTAKISGWRTKTLQVKVYYGDGESNTLDSGSQNFSNFAGVKNTTNHFFIGATQWSSGQNPTNYFNGFIDEIGMVDAVADANDIQDTYNNQRNHKNADGSDRTCNTCAVIEDPTFRFDTWDTFRNLNDRNISTKLVSQDFQLTLASLNETNDNYQEFNGTVCTQIIEEKPSSWVKSTFNDTNTSTLSFNVSNAIKDTKIAIKWWKNSEALNVTCNDGSEDNSTISSDNFAIRPDRYRLIPTGPYYAGENFLLEGQALDVNGIAVTDYNETQSLGSFSIEGNETRQDCQTGSENFYSDDAVFSHGVTPSLDANFTGLATDLNLKIHENNGSEFAKVDGDDTTDALRLISPHDINVSVNPYELNVTLSEMNASTLTSWLYMADVNDMNLSLHVRVQANNKQHEVLKDFNASCYAQDLDLDFDVSVVNGDSALDMNYSTVEGTLTTSGTTLGDINQSMRISSSEFVDGVGDASYALNVDRSFEVPITPFSVSGLGATITSSALAKEINNDTDQSDGTFAFYYGRVLGKDVKVMTNVTNPLQIEVYKRNDLNASGWRQNSLNWYQNQDHSGAIFGDVITHSVKENTNFVGSSDANVNASINTPNAGVIDVDISTTHTHSVNRVFHLDVDRWLWYMPESFGKAYRYQAGSSNCQEHPCFNYTFKASDGANEISSGDFSGSDVVKKDRGEYIKKGIKVFR